MTDILEKLIDIQIRSQELTSQLIEECIKMEKRISDLEEKT